MDWTKAASGNKGILTGGSLVGESTAHGVGHDGAQGEGIGDEGVMKWRLVKMAT